MKTLYVDNYKGFRDTFIPLKDVNFFVGNNSTGKTAILNLLTLIMDQNFWNNPSFNTDLMEMGYFDDIVNHYSADKKSFSFAVEFCKGDLNDYYWMKFESKNNIPCLCEYMQTIGKKTVKLKFQKDKLFYQDRVSKKESFPKWVKNANEFKSCKELSIFSSQISNMPIMAILATKAGDGNKKETIDDPFMHYPISYVMWDSYKGFAPIRAKVHRNYDSFKQNFSSEGEHIPVKLRDIYASKDGKKYSKIRAKLNKFGETSALFDKLNVVEFNRKGSSPYSIDVIYDKHPVNISNVGYGVSQVLPLVVEMVACNDSLFSIQQPEVHLHPKAQAEYGDLLFASSTDNKNRFIIETHSDYTINRFRYRMNKSKKKVTAQIVFFERNKEGMKVTPLPFDDNGKFLNALPDSYSDFFVDEELKMLEF